VTEKEARKVVMRVLKGGPGSGAKGHKGIPGHQGGGLPLNSPEKLSYTEMYKWATNIVKSELVGKTNNNDLISEMQNVAFGTDKQLFVARMKNGEVLPKPKKPRDNNWLDDTEAGTIPPEFQYLMQKHFDAQGAGSNVVLPREIRAYSDGLIDRNTLGRLYSRNLEKYFGWETNGGLDQLRLKNEYKYSKNGIVSKSQAMSDEIKKMGYTPESLWDELQKLK
jgi:hypothetical protein